MVERRTVERQRTDGVGSIAVDEHTSLACLIYDISDFGVRLTLPQAEAVPATFVLNASCLSATRVCKVAWRTDESIGAKFCR
ncbi:PilZ domain-containing protein [Methylobacterium sp. WL120]|uniref:PilZ domain-containing protein n=1 Tax=Methylobacterium sp. WL120 TaxID=2603887 RepID=UPI0011CA3A58|nr:PilZ domain-containing protein [Methylobacterium sp. WL120]TXM65852.1 PilZ domain-containing protein [Methylobacterium sp. WL120]